MSTLSADIPSKLPTGSPIFVLESSAKANIKTLKFIANKTGGQFFNLLELEVCFSPSPSLSPFI
jgi:hypothetical protein